MPDIRAALMRSLLVGIVNFPRAQREWLQVVFAVSTIYSADTSKFSQTMLLSSMARVVMVVTKVHGGNALVDRALVLQEYDFDIDFWKGKQNVNADALSRRYSPCAITQVESHLPLTEIRTSQQSDSTLSQVLQACQQPESPICNSRWDDIDNSGLKLNWLMTFSVENIHQVLSRRK